MSNPSKPIRPAGASGRLDILVRDKTFQAVDGHELKAIAEVAFDAAPGSFTTLIGPSGCGKTTTLRIILGLDTDYIGHVKLPREDGRVAAVFQEPRLLPWRTVEANVRLALPDDMRGADLGALFETLGLEGMRSRYPAELSLGLARRTALARAFAIEPALLLLDEPFVSLDEMTANRLRSLLMEIRSARPTTALMVTHNLREAVELSDRIVFLTPRPATIRGVWDLSTPRPARNATWREATVAEIDRMYPGVL